MRPVAEHSLQFQPKRKTSSGSEHSRASLVVFLPESIIMPRKQVCGGQSERGFVQLGGAQCHKCSVQQQLVGGTRAGDPLGPRPWHPRVAQP